MYRVGQKYPESVIYTYKGIKIKFNLEIFYTKL